MLILPSLRAVVLQPPRTGSTSLRDAVLARWPDAVSLHRHMERDGIPEPFATWTVIATVREPVERLYSLWKYMRCAPEEPAMPGWTARIRADADRPFEAWLLESREAFSHETLDGVSLPYYRTRHRMPIARKSLFHTLRPDLGPIEIFRFEAMDALARRLDVALAHKNRSEPGGPPSLSVAGRAHVDRYHAWDRALYPTST